MGKKPSLGIGLDIGTMNLVSARRGDKGITTRRMRDVFLTLDKSAKKMLKLSKVKFIERDDDVVVTGDAALEIASTFNQEARRPLSGGLISTREGDALEILGILIKSVLGPPAEEDEACYFSVPAAPVDAQRDVVYHTGVFERIVSQCGYEAYASNEAMAIIFAETAAEGFSGIGISMGAGMTNIALAVNALEGMTFSVARGGDWIDSGVATSLGSTQSRVCAIKERGVDLMNPQNREEEAISFYYKNLIEYALKHIAMQFKLNCQLAIPRAIPIVVGGGTSLAGGLMDLFTSVFEKKYKKKFPIEISDIRHANNALETVAHGLLVQAMQEYDED